MSFSQVFFQWPPCNPRQQSVAQTHVSYHIICLISLYKWHMSKCFYDSQGNLPCRKQIFCCVSCLIWKSLFWLNKLFCVDVNLRVNADILSAHCNRFLIYGTLQCVSKIIYCLPILPPYRLQHDA